MGGISMRNFGMFRKLCGDSALRNVVIVTNRWGEVDPQVGEAREAELAREDIFFKPVLDLGVQMARHENIVPSAERIVRLILNNHPLPLRIQEELVTEGKKVTETDAGEELNRELNAQIRKHQREKQVLMEGMQKVIREKEEETRRKLEFKTQRMKIEIERLESDHEEEKERFNAHMRQVESEAKKEWNVLQPFTRG
jgi:ATP-dependent Lon protease